MHKERSSTQKTISVVVSIILVLALLVGACYWLFKGNNVRTIKVDDTIDKGVVMVLRTENKESKEVDVKTLKVVSLGEEIVIHYDGEIAVNEEIDVDTYLIIKGVVETKDGRLLVNDNVEVRLITNEITE